MLRTMMQLSRMNGKSHDVEHVRHSEHHTVLFWMRVEENSTSSGQFQLAAAITFELEEGAAVRGWGTAARGSTHTTTPQDGRVWTERLQLTPRETSVAELAVFGLRDKEIAARLLLQPTSVAKYMRQVLRKAGVRNRCELPVGAGVLRIG